jgi:hypothetical protein
MRGNVATADIARAAVLLFPTGCLAASFLRKSGHCECEKKCKGCDDSLHVHLRELI